MGSESEVLSHRDSTPAQNAAKRGLLARKQEISGGGGVVAGAERSPMLGKINDLRTVRVEIAPLNAKEDFAATRTCFLYRRMWMERGKADAQRC
jgi:hypothetical protein